MQASLDKGADLVSNATRLIRFLELRKIDDLLRAAKTNKDDLIASDIGIDAASVLGDEFACRLQPTISDIDSAKHPSGLRAEHRAAQVKLSQEGA